VEVLLADADRLYREAQAALKDGDLGTYQSKLEEAYQKAAAAASKATGTTVTPAPTTTLPPDQAASPSSTAVSA
jgi:hypothetical protein